ncbi:MAG: 4Fe-4S binding protein [Candidatus Bathyarchaeota archaeon]|nr:4Fe-4S binding protein [Candidatus Bathyarchaeota archaeon]
MRAQAFKTVVDKYLMVWRATYVKRFSLSLDRDKCIGCDICQTVCPKEAIKIVIPSRAHNAKLGCSVIDIDENRCNYCGICSAICPRGAFKLKINEMETIPVIEKEAFPKIIRHIEVIDGKCPRDCDICVKACPFNLIEVKFDEEKGKIEVFIDKEHCPACRLCEIACPYNAITVKKIFYGSIRINMERCKEGCHDCADVCPIPNVLQVLNNGKVEVDQTFCIYCGACKVVCPVDSALEFSRTFVCSTDVHSGAWNKALEKLTSPKIMAKKLYSRLTAKARDSVDRLQ